MTDYQIDDLYCGAGLASDGYAAIFGARNVHGYDINPQPDYPYDFHKEDVLDLLLDYPRDVRRPPKAHARHASPPCQLFTTAGHLRDAQGGKSKYDDLLTPTLAMLRGYWNSQPWVVENVLDNKKQVLTIMEPRAGEYRIILCATMFGLPMWRHRVFLANFPLRQPEPTGDGVYGAWGCRHDTLPLDPITGKPRPWGVSHVANDKIPSGGRTAVDAEHGRQVMGVYRTLPWDSLKEGFPPAYTSWVGADMLAALRGS
jgi:DNA (cytosine-5)-methyltransferase 1